MATSFKIYKNLNLFIVQSSGPANLEEVLDILRQLQDDPDFSPKLDSLWDACGRTTPFKESDAFTLANHLKPYESIRDSKRAFLVSSDLHFGMVRMFLTYHYGPNRDNLGVFKNRDKALKWLGIKDPTL